MPELRESASRLLAVGVSADRIIPLLTRLGDATAAMGTGAFGIQRAVYALQQMSQAGKVSLEDINQLTDAGIPALDALSAKLGTTVSKLREQISAGKIKPEQLFEAILQGAGKTFPRLQGMMVRQSATLAGIWSTFKDNTSQSLAKFAEPMIPGIKRAIDWTSTNLPKALSWIREQGAKAGDFLGTKTPIKGEWMAALRKLGQEVLPVLRDAWKDLQTWVSQNHDKLERISRFITEFLIPSFGTWLVGAIRATVGAIKLAITVTDEVITAFKWMTRQVLGFLKNLLDAAVINFGWIPGLGPKLKEAQKKFKEFADGILTQLDRVDGKVVDVYVRAHGDLEFTEGNRNERRGGHRAAGGPVWRGEAYTINEMGVESYYAAATGVIESNEKLRNRMSGIGSSNEVIGVLEVVHKTPDGNVLWTELKALKRRKNLSSLGL
jgi:tape measure domain-containing protein